MYVLLSVYLAHWKLVVVLRMRHNGEAAHTQHVGKRIVEVVVKSIKHVAHGNVLDMQVCSMRRRLECHHHQGVGKLRVSSSVTPKFCKISWMICIA